MKHRIYIYSLVIVLCVLVSCLKETPLLVRAEFEHVIDSPNQTTPLTVSFKNTTTGADRYEWTFDGGEPKTSKEKNPPKVTFAEPGNHIAKLRAWNDTQEHTTELTVRVDSTVTIAFDPQIELNDYAPAKVLVVNKTRGAATFDWLFEGGTPQHSNEQHPGQINFDNPGTYTIKLTTTNGSETFTTEQTITLKPKLVSDFAWKPIVADLDMEAPLTAVVENKSQNYVSVLWSCPEGTIANSSNDKTTIRFQREGTYTVKMTAYNLKEHQSVEKQIVVKPNSRLHTFRELKFGIHEAQNTIGVFFSTDLQRVLQSEEVKTPEIGKSVDVGFFSLNSSFDHCYFFSPDRARAAAFAEIPSAIVTKTNNISPNTPTPEKFDQITTAAGFDQFSFFEGNDTDFFSLDNLPYFVFFNTQDNRRGVIYVKQTIANQGNSYVVADIKIEKRVDE